MVFNLRYQDQVGRRHKEWEEGVQCACGDVILGNLGNGKQAPPCYIPYPLVIYSEDGEGRGLEQQWLGLELIALVRVGSAGMASEPIYKEMGV